MIRFTNYSRHGPNWLMHADVSVKFKDWINASDFNAKIAESFFRDPEKYFKTIESIIEVSPMTKITKYIVSEHIWPDVWPITNAQQGLPIGTAIYRFDGNDYGCVKDDATYGQVETVACTYNSDGTGPFFTVPVQYLIDYETLEHPKGLYEIKSEIRTSEQI